MLYTEEYLRGLTNDELLFELKKVMEEMVQKNMTPEQQQEYSGYGMLIANEGMRRQNDGGTFLDKASQ